MDIHLELDEQRGTAIQRRFLGDTHRGAGNHPCALMRDRLAEDGPGRFTVPPGSADPAIT